MPLPRPDDGDSVLKQVEDLLDAKIDAREKQELLIYGYDDGQDRVTPLGIALIADGFSLKALKKELENDYVNSVKKWKAVSVQKYHGPNLDRHTKVIITLS